MNKLDLVLQGSANEYSFHIAEHYLSIPFVNNVIISCWENDIDFPSNPRIKVIKNKDVSNPGIGNRNRQIQSSRGGLNLVETDFCAKLRTDQKISIESMNLMNEFYDKFKNRKLTFDGDFTKPLNRICVAGMFSPFPFHPRDHIFWGNTKDLKDVFNIPYDTVVCPSSRPPACDDDYKFLTRAETYIGSHYCAKFDKKIYDFIENPLEYLTDAAPKRHEALKISNKISDEIFKVFPRIHFEWPKYYMKDYHYWHNCSVEHWHDESW